MNNDTIDLRAETDTDGQLDIAALCRRVITAERALWLAGRVAAWPDEDDDNKATSQAWSEWHSQYGDMVLPVTPEQVAELAARRDEIADRTVAEIRRQREAEGW